MSGGRAPYQKGYRFESEIRQICESHGVPCRRTPMSKKPDLWINHRPVSAKRRKVIPKWIEAELEDHDYILLRGDRGRIVKIGYWSLGKGES